MRFSLVAPKLVPTRRSPLQRLIGWITSLSRTCRLSSAILRAERNNSVELISAIRSQISNALAENASGHNHYRLTGFSRPFRDDTPSFAPQFARKACEDYNGEKMDTQFSLAVCFPVWNRADLFLACYNSLLRQLEAWKPAFGFLTMEVTLQPAPLLVI